MTAASGRARAAAIGQALLVTLLWSSSWVLIKIGLDDLDLEPLGFAGLRYTLAAIVLAPFAWRLARRAGRGSLDRAAVRRLAVLGLLLYAVTQGAQFAALDRLPAAAVSLTLVATPVLVALLGIRMLDERPAPFQLAGVLAMVAGAVLYFGRLSLDGAVRIGLAIALVGLLANALSALYGRSVMRDQAERLGGALVVTALSMGVGGPVLLAAGLALEGVPTLTVRAWAIVGWLAVVNTAVAFVLWNHTLEVLTAVESSVLNNTMLVQIAILAWIFVGEALDVRQLAGLAAAAAGVLLVQVFPARGQPPPVAIDPSLPRAQ